MTEPVPPPPPSSGAVPVCPRHPDRVSYVRCQRCGRPACPECQRPAAVGVHCVDCVREASRTAPVTRSVFGAPMRGGRPVGTVTLVAMCVASFALQLVVGAEWTRLWIFAPFIGAAEPWRFLTAAFLHSPVMLLHIVFNMYALWIVGQSLEPAFGRWRFLTLYLLSAVGGSVMMLLLASPYDESWGQSVVGASGAVFGLFGALLVVLRRLRRDARSIVVLLVINGVLGFVVPSIAWEAHLGGLVVGAVLGAAYAWAPRERRTAVGVGASALVGIALVAAAVGKYVSVPGFALFLG